MTPFLLRLAFGTTAVWLAAAVATWVARRSSAAVRHRLWSLATAAVLALPLLIPLLPEQRLRPPSPSPSQPGATAAQPHAMPTRIPPDVAVEAAAGPDHLLKSPAFTADVSTVPIRPTPPVRYFPWATLAWLAWAGPAVLLLGRQGAGWAAARRLLRRSRPVPASLDEQSRAVPARGGRRPRLARATSDAEPTFTPRDAGSAGPGPGRPGSAARVRESADITTPLCVGMLRPAVVLPVDWRSWSADKLSAVLTHESAHAARRDVVWQTLAGVATAVYWPHPLAWVAAWRLRVERELACDDCVVRAGGPAAPYARLLVDFAATGPALTGTVAMACTGNLERRITALLDGHRRRLPVSRRLAVVLILMTVAVALTCTILSPLRRTASTKPTTATAATDGAPAEAAETVTVPGRAVDVAGRPVADAEVRYIVGTMGQRQPVTRTDADGRFTLRLTSAEADAWAEVWVRGRDGGDQGFATVVSARLRSGQPLTITARPAKHIPVRVVDGHGAAVAGAWVGTTLEQFVVNATTDANGTATLSVPADAELRGVVADRPGVGLDYVFADDAAGLAAKPVLLTLAGARSVSVRAADRSGRPLAGVAVQQLSATNPARGREMNLVFLHDHFQAITDANGIAAFASVPAGDRQPVEFRARLAGYVEQGRCEFDPVTPQRQPTAVLAPVVRVTGRVVDSAGNPAPDVRVRVGRSGSGGVDNLPRDTRTDPAGRFAFDVAPDECDLFIATDRHQAPAPVMRVVRDRPPAEPVVLRLRPATRVHGRVLGGDRNAPAPNASVVLYTDDDSYGHLPVNQRLPDGAFHQPDVYVDSATTGPDGQYELWAAPGPYRISANVSGIPSVYQIITVTGPAETAVDLHVASAVPPAMVTLRGRVVRRGHPDRVLAGAAVKLYTEVGDGLHPEPIVSQPDGTFELTRAATRADAFVRAATADEALAGMATVRPGDTAVTVEVDDAATVTGRLIDTGGRPVPNMRLDYGLVIGRTNATDPSGRVRQETSYTLVGRANTDADGRFRFAGLASGYEYRMFGRYDAPYPPPILTPSLRPDRAGQQIDLGDVRLPKPAPWESRTARRPTTRRAATRRTATGPATRRAVP